MTLPLLDPDQAATAPGGNSSISQNLLARLPSLVSYQNYSNIVDKLIGNCTGVPSRPLQIGLFFPVAWAGRRGQDANRIKTGRKVQDSRAEYGPSIQSCKIEGKLCSCPVTKVEGRISSSQTQAQDRRQSTSS
jgi:hypothetical protein